MSDSVQDRPIDEIKRLRQALDAETRRCLELRRQLDQTGAEFEQFVSMAAHNLREPLRSVAAYSQLLSECYAARPDSEASAFLERIQEGAASMQSILSGVVDYWAAGIGDGQSSRTDMAAVLRQALLSLDPQITEHSAIVTNDPLPAVMGDFEMLAKVLQHLIRNAIEYCGTPCPHVHVSSLRADLEWVFSVRDNGPGIDPEFQGRLFVAFKRLHGKEHPGNGLGLAFCKKAIESQGGRVWIESTLGAGSTFYFTIAPAD
jgi:light-regulated signal transduction histidine kinase (bacteriophytochrome)